MNPEDAQRSPSSPLHTLAKAILDGDRKSLAQAITVAESNRPEDISRTGKLLEILEQQVDSMAKIIAITGPPGVGKSSFIESMGLFALAADLRLAVLTIDPTSDITGGSILADKTRMPELSKNTNAFIRPSPSGGALGGLNNRTWEVKKLCEAAGYHIIFIETVGVGQSESEVTQLVDMTCLLVQPGSGDEFQSMKKGLIEKADFFIVNKADGNQQQLAREAKSILLSTSKLTGQNKSSTKIALHSMHDEELRLQCWDMLMACYKALNDDGIIAIKRRKQLTYWLHKKTQAGLIHWITNDDLFKTAGEELARQLEQGEINLQSAINQLIGQAKRIIK